MTSHSLPGRQPSRRGPKSEAAEETLDVAQLVRQFLRQGESDIYRKVGIAVDRAVMEAVLRHTKGNQAKASELLGISRTTLRAKLRVLGVAIEKQLVSEPSRRD